MASGAAKAGQTALVIAMPECEPYVSDIRARYDATAALGVPAHITLLYPFIAPDRIDAKALSELEDLFDVLEAFEFAFSGTERFENTGTLYLAPTHAERFIAITEKLCARYPDCPLYGGVHAEIVPHLTLANGCDDAELSILQTGFSRRHANDLPIRARAERTTLLENRTGRWTTRACFKFKY